MADRSEVEITYRKRIGTEQYYFDVLVRSVKHPERLFGSIVDRSGTERRDLGIAAGALAEHIGEMFNETRNPDTAARAAMSAYDRLNALNPIPRWGEEPPRS